MTATAQRALGIAFALLLVGAVVLGQAVADSRVPTGATADAGATVGRAAFSYLTGLRSLAAYTLWNRLEPQLHEYYVTQALKDQLFSVPTMRLVMWLKPDFVQPYYIMPWILMENGRDADARALALEGIDNNPTSGLLLMSYAQMLSVRYGDWAAAATYADRAVAESAQWADDLEEWESLRVAESIYLHEGLASKAAALGPRLAELAKRIDSAPAADATGSAHDHNGDGVPDH